MNVVWNITKFNQKSPSKGFWFQCVDGQIRKINGKKMIQRLSKQQAVPGRLDLPLFQARMRSVAGLQVQQNENIDGKDLLCAWRFELLWEISVDMFSPLKNGTTPSPHPFLSPPKNPESERTRVASGFCLGFTPGSRSPPRIRWMLTDSILGWKHLKPWKCLAINLWFIM